MVVLATIDSFTKRPSLHCKETALSGHGTTTTTITTEKGVPPPPQKTEDGVQYCLRGHQLKLTDVPMRDIINCDGCKERGFSLRYRCCQTCDFVLHKECFQPPLTLQHPHFPGHTFHFLLHPPTETRWCDACGKGVRGYVYHCKEGGRDGWDLHPCCSVLPRNIRFSDGSPEVSLREDTNRGLRVGRKNTKACFRCKSATLQETTKDVPGWSYVSACGNARGHVYCMMERIEEVRGSVEKSRSRNLNSTKKNRGEDWEEMLSITNTVAGLVLGNIIGFLL